MGNKTYTFYRADDRTDCEIKKANGFKAWVPLEPKQARMLIKRYDNKSIANVELPRRASDFMKKVNNTKKQKLLDLSCGIKVNKDRSTFQISTDLSEDCGGSSNINTFKIQYTNLYIHDFIETERNPDSLKVNKPFHVKFITDTGSLDSANVIAVTCKQEVFFLTQIPQKYIVEYRPKNGKWQKF